MSFLAPLYILGALLVGVPVLLHLIRRRPRGEVRFSSIMFLTPTPPRLTRRSRIDDWLLLLLRSAAVLLLAIAFARPFLREALLMGAAEGGQRRVVILIDTSASMRRGDLWKQAQAEAEGAVAALRPGDQVALFAFDKIPRRLMSFEESATLDPARRFAIARGRLGGLSPTWGATDLGRALLDAVQAARDVDDIEEESTRLARRIVLISDLQSGARVETLGGFEWPSDVELEVRSIHDERPNATLHALGNGDNGERETEGDAVRVAVTNEAGMSADRFALDWAGVTSATTSVSVPPGERRVVQVAWPTSGTRPSSLVLTGDAHPFDNTIYLADTVTEVTTVVFAGEDRPDDPAGLLYYLERAFLAVPMGEVKLKAFPRGTPIAWAKDEQASLVVVAGEVSAADVEALRGFAARGGTILVVLSSPDQASTAASLGGVVGFEAMEANVEGDKMIGEVDFDHPLFAPLASSRFNDFTKIRFWRYRKVADDVLGEGSRVLARFEGGDPALIERRLGTGRLVLMTSGWAPADSQLARSSKFVPLMMGLLGVNDADEGGRVLRVGDSIPLPPSGSGAGPVIVQRPDGSRVELAAGSASFDGTDEPGIYRVDTGDEPLVFPVNLDPLEGMTTPLGIEALEQLGCRLVGSSVPALDVTRERQLHGVELEGRQKIWRWLIVAAIMALILETLLAGRSRPMPAPGESAAT